MKQILKKCFSTYKNIIDTPEIPYTFGGLNFKYSNIKKSFESHQEFLNYIDENNEEKDKNIFSFFRSELKISKEFENLIDKVYNQFSEGIVNYFNKDIKLDQDLLDFKFYNKLTLLNNHNNNYEKYKLIKDSKNKNKYYVDKIFLHCNLNKFNRIDSNLNYIENIFSKNLVIFHYGQINNRYCLSSVKEHLDKFNYNIIDLFSSEKYKERMKNTALVVRLSVWVKVANNIITENQNIDLSKDPELKRIYDYKIYDDEWHHLLIEFDDSLEHLNYLDILRCNSFPRIISKIINRGKNISSRLLKDKIKVKVSDFDFYMAGNPISESEDQFRKNELYFIKNKI